MKSTRKPHAIYVITKHGVGIAKKLREGFPEADLYVSPKFLDQAPAGSLPLSLPMDSTLRETFQAYDCHTFIISVGAVVRMIAHLLEDKKTDPAVICVDDRAKFSICVLSGHVGRGNQYTHEVAQTLGSIPVVTTASDVSGTLTVDILGRDLGWRLENSSRNVTRACAAVVNETRVLFVQETGEPDWWPENKTLPKGVEYRTSLDGVNPTDFEILLIASDRANIRETHPGHYENSVIYHPRTLILGLGCDREVPFEVVETGVLQALKENGLSPLSVKGIATIDKKASEPAFIQLSEKYGWPIQTYPAETLDSVAGVLNPSEQPKKHVGTRSVSEAAALLAADTKELLVPKWKFRAEEGGKNLTVAVARIPHAKRNTEQGVSR